MASPSDQSFEGLLAENASAIALGVETIRHAGAAFGDYVIVIADLKNAEAVRFVREITQGVMPKDERTTWVSVVGRRDVSLALRNASADALVDTDVAPGCVRVLLATGGQMRCLDVPS